MLAKLLIIENDQDIQSFGYDEHGKLIYHIKDDDKTANLEAIYCVRVNSLNKKAKFAYIDYAPNQQGVVNLKNTNVQSGSYLLCQLQWQGEPPKLPKFSEDIKLIGKYVILLPTTSQHFFSKQLKSKLTEIGQQYAGIGIIFRSAIDDITCHAVPRHGIQIYDAKKQLVSQEIDFLIKQAASLKSGPVNSITQRTVPVYKFMQLLREARLTATIQVFTNSQTIFDDLMPYMDLWQLDAISLDESLMADKLINAEKLLKTRAEFGLEIHQLSGINLIDINSKNSQLSFYQVNNLAIDEIVRQIWLRDLTGIILLDFIKNMSKQEEQQLTAKLNQYLTNDWRKNQILGFTKAGICEIIRNK